MVRRIQVMAHTLPFEPLRLLCEVLELPPTPRLAGS
jgi:hypothetical protein